MGSSSNYQVIQQEAEFIESKRLGIARDAAIYVSLGETRENAVDLAVTQDARRNEAIANDEYEVIDEENSVIRFRDPKLEGPINPKRSAIRQIEAIARELYVNVEACVKE